MRKLKYRHTSNAHFKWACLNISRFVCFQTSTDKCFINNCTVLKLTIGQHIKLNIKVKIACEID